MAKPDTYSDTRRSGKLTHHSARGAMPRNAGNFTRGSQLITHEYMMWFGSVRIPLTVWFFLFLITFSITSYLVIREHEAQMILMKLYAAGWQFMEFNSAKIINLTLPSGQVIPAPISMVGSHPDVVAAWSRLTRAFWGSAFMSAFVAVPLTIWFIDASHKRGRGILEERHQRGAMLVDADELSEVVAAHNGAEFEKEAQRCFPDNAPGEVLRLPFAARKAGGIHHPYSLAGVRYPWRTEQSHTMLIGTTGTGKTTQMRDMIAQMTVLQGVNNSREELRHASTYQVGQVLEARARVSEIGLPKGSYTVSGIDARGRITLRDGKLAIRFDPQKIDPANRQDRMSLSERVSLKLNDGDTILWREHDKPRDIVKSTYAKIVKADGQGVTVELADKRQLHLSTSDPMLARLDLGYALNAHMAQGMTKPEAIEVIGSYQRNLATQRTQNVLNTRATDDVRVVTDDLGRLKLQLDRTPGNKTSALEAVGRIEVDRKPPDPFAKRDLPPLAMSPELKAKVEAVMPTPEPKMLPVPEKKLGLDLA